MLFVLHFRLAAVNWCVLWTIKQKKTIATTTTTMKKEQMSDEQNAVCIIVVENREITHKYLQYVKQWFLVSLSFGVYKAHINFTKQPH